jgi:Tol biopolymer transport system component
MLSGRIIIFIMKVRAWITIVILFLLVVVGIGFYGWKMRPQLIDIYPRSGAADVPVIAPIRLVFSRSMQPETVNTNLKIEPVIEGSFSWDKNILTFTPDQPWPGGQEITLRLRAGARATSWMVFPMGGQSWSFKTSGGTLAYLWPSTGSADIYTLDPVTGEISQYTHGMGVLEYCVSSDGMMIYLSASNSQGGADLYQIDRIKAEGLPNSSYQAVELLKCGVAQCRSPAVSFDDHYLAYEYLLPTPRGGLGPAQIWVISLPDLNASPVGQPTHETVQPSWSSSGLLAYYDRTSNGYEVVNPLTQARVQFPNQTGQPGIWSPDGEYYLAPEINYFQAVGNSETGTSHLLRYRIQNSTSEDLSRANDVEDVDASYSPDGGTIAFARKFLDAVRWSLGRQLWIMNADGSNPHPITDEADYNHYDLAWSRDGLTLAYVRFNQAKLSDLPELWMVNTDGSNPVQLVIGGYSPIWIP